MSRQSQLRQEKPRDPGHNHGQRADLPPLMPAVNSAVRNQDPGICEAGARAEPPSTCADLGQEGSSGSRCALQDLQGGCPASSHSWKRAPGPILRPEPRWAPSEKRLWNHAVKVASAKSKSSKLAAGLQVRLKLQRAVQHRFATSATGREGKARRIYRLSQSYNFLLPQSSARLSLGKPVTSKGT